MSDMRVQFNGRIPAFQAGRVGSIPITRSIKMRQQLSWIEQLPSKQQVGGSSPSWRAIWWVWPSWLGRQIVALEIMSSTLITHPSKKRPFKEIERPLFHIFIFCRLWQWILGCRQAVRHRTLTPASRGFESRQPSHQAEPGRNFAFRLSFYFGLFPAFPAGAFLLNCRDSNEPA